MTDAVESKYKCDHWLTPTTANQLGTICPRCHLVLSNKYQRLLEFVKKTKFPFEISLEAVEILQEIGELND